MLNCHPNCRTLLSWQVVNIIKSLVSWCLEEWAQNRCTLLWDNSSLKKFVLHTICESLWSVPHWEMQAKKMWFGEQLLFIKLKLLKLKKYVFTWKFWNLTTKNKAEKHIQPSDYSTAGQKDILIAGLHGALLVTTTYLLRNHKIIKFQLQLSVLEWSCLLFVNKGKK